MKCTIRTFLESRVGVLEHSQLFPGFDSLTRVSQSTQKIAKNAPQAAWWPTPGTRVFRPRPRASRFSVLIIHCIYF